MTMNKFDLKNAVKSPNREIVIANNTKLSIDCMGEVDLNLLTDEKQTTVTIKNVQYVLDPCANLLPVSQMIRNGNHVRFNRDSCKIYNKKNDLVATASLVANMYKLNSVPNPAV